MQESTKKSVLKKCEELIKCIENNNIFNLYKLLEFNTSSKSSQKEIIKIIFDKVGKNKLLNIYNQIEVENPFKFLRDCTYRGERGYPFGVRGNCKHRTWTETTIQRDIYFNSEQYKDVLSDIIGYEVTTAYIKNKKRVYPIDLISFSSDNCEINLIELKDIDGKELLLRAMFEIKTYTSFFKKALEEDPFLARGIAREIKARTNKTISEEQVKNSKINKIILAPESIINEKNADYLKDFIKNENFLFYTIAKNKNFPPMYENGKKGKFFDIKKNK